MSSTTPIASTPRPSGVACSARSSAPYRDDYRPVPFSKHYVRHIEGWYAQKHPDEDFAETFAVWLTPRSAWRRQYKGWPAMQKLRYVERVARALADVEPIVKTGEVDITPDDISVTVEQFYEQAAQERQARIDIALDAHLGADLPDPQAQGIEARRRYREQAPAGAGREDHLLDGRAAADRQGLIDSICRTCERMKLWGEVGEEARYLVEVTALATTLAMNFLTRGQFEQLAIRAPTERRLASGVARSERLIMSDDGLRWAN